VIDGFATHSYGVPCARLAGVPDIVTARAAELLKTLHARGDVFEQPVSQISV